MRNKTQHMIEGYVQNEIFPMGTADEVSDLMLFLQLACYQEYAELATVFDRIDDIPGLHGISKSIDRLHHIFSRHHSLLKKLNIFTPIYRIIFCIPPSFNPDNSEHKAQFLKTIGISLESYTKQYVDLFQLSLVKDYDIVLKKLLFKSSKRQLDQHRNLSDLEIKTAIKKQLRHMGKEENPGLIDELKLQYIEHGENLRRLFKQNIQLKEIQYCKRIFKKLIEMSSGKTGQKTLHIILQNFAQSRFFNRGIYFRISPEVKLTIKSYLIAFILTNIIITLLATYVVPQVSILSSTAIFNLILYAGLNLIPILIPVIVNKINQTSNKIASENHKQKLVLELDKKARKDKMHEYHSRLQNIKFDFREDGKPKKRIPFPRSTLTNVSIFKKKAGTGQGLQTNPLLSPTPLKTMAYRQQPG